MPFWGEGRSSKHCNNYCEACFRIQAKFLGQIQKYMKDKLCRVSSQLSGFWCLRQIQNPENICCMQSAWRELQGVSERLKSYIRHFSEQPFGFNPLLNVFVITLIQIDKMDCAILYNKVWKKYHFWHCLPLILEQPV